MGEWGGASLSFCTRPLGTLLAQLMFQRCILLNWFSGFLMQWEIPTQKTSQNIERACDINTQSDEKHANATMWDNPLRDKQWRSISALISSFIPVSGFTNYVKNSASACTNFTATRDISWSEGDSLRLRKFSFIPFPISPILSSNRYGDTAESTLRLASLSFTWSLIE